MHVFVGDKWRLFGHIGEWQNPPILQFRIGMYGPGYRGGLQSQYMLSLEQTVFVLAGRVSTCYFSYSASAIPQVRSASAMTCISLQMELATVDLWTPFGTDLHFREGPKHCLGPRAYNELITKVKGNEGHKATMLGEGKQPLLVPQFYF